MKKEKKGGKLIIAVGAIAICTVTAGAFFRKDIIYKYYEYSVNKNYSSTNVKVNDYLLIHAGFAISKLAKNEGEERIKLFKELEGYEDE